MQETHINSTNQAHINLSIRLTLFANNTTSDITQLKEVVQNEISSIKNHSLLLVLNHSMLASQVSVLDGDLGLIKAQLRNLSSMHTDLQIDFAATKETFYITREAIRQNVSQLHDLVRHVERDHSLLCLLYTSPSPRDATLSRMPSSA